MTSYGFGVTWINNNFMSLLLTLSFLYINRWVIILFFIYLISLLACLNQICSPWPKQNAPLFSNSFYYSLNFFLTPSGPFVFLPFFLSLTAGLIKALYSLCLSEQSNNRERVSRMSTTTSPHINSDYGHAWHLKQYNLCPQYSLANALHFCISSQYRKKNIQRVRFTGTTHTVYNGLVLLAQPVTQKAVAGCEKRTLQWPSLPFTKIQRSTVYELLYRNSDERS